MNNRTSSLLVIFGFLIFLISACEKETSNTTCENSPIIVLQNDEYNGSENPYQNGFFVLNEGGFTYGNASVSHVNGGTVNQNVFSTKNEYALGDVLQSATERNGELYLIVNNSQKIEAVNSDNFERKRTLTGFSSPRYLAFRDDTYAAVTDFAANEILLVDMQSGCIKNRMTVSGWTEQILYHNQQFYVIDRTPIGESNDFARVLVLDKDLSSQIVSIDIALEPNSMVLDEEGSLWILSSGKESENEKPALTKINTSTNGIVSTLVFPTYSNVPLNLVYSAVNDELYYHIGPDIYTMDITATELPVSNSFTTETENIYNLNVHPTTGDIYIADAKDYVSAGQVLQYSSAGNLLNTYDVGIIPSEIVF